MSSRSPFPVPRSPFRRASLEYAVRGLLTHSLVIVTLLLGEPPSFATPTPPLNCAASPFGPPDPGGYIRLPYKLSSRRFQYDRAENPGQKYYANNTNYKWQTWFSGNVTKVKFGFDIGDASSPGFQTEYGYDYLNIGTIAPLMGNLDNDHTVSYLSAASDLHFDTTYDNYANMTWNSDYLYTDEGWTITSAWVYCGRTNQPAGASSLITKLGFNEQRDGVLLGTGDIRHFSAVVPADRSLLIHLKQDAFPAPGTLHADYDLYVSRETTTTTPGPDSYDWRSVRTTGPGGRMDEDTVLVQPWDGIPHNVYFSVYAYKEDLTNPGGFRVYDNVIGQTFTFNAGADFSFVNSDGGVDWTPIMIQNLYGATAGLYQATDGTGLIVEWKLWNFDSTCGGQGCNVLFTNPYKTSECIGLVCAFLNGARILDRAWGQGSGSHGYTLSHEFGHCLYGMHDEYNSADAGTGFKCGHSVMSSGAYLNATDYCTGTSAACVQGSPIAPNGNHNADCVTPGPVPPGIAIPSYWPRIQGCFPNQTQYHLPGGSPPTPDPEVWIYGQADISDIFQYRNYTVITKQNF